MPDDLIKGLQELLVRSDQIVLLDHSEELLGFCSIFFEEACGGCLNQKKDCLRRLRRMDIEEIKEKIRGMRSNKFKLKKGALVRFWGSSQAYSDENINDEVALRWLRENPNRISNFSAYPQGWDQILEGEAKAQPSDAKSSLKPSKGSLKKDEKPADTNLLKS